MGFEVLLLNNLLILLNYLTQTDTAIPQIVSYFVEIFNFNQISLAVLILFILTFYLKQFQL